MPTGTVIFEIYDETVALPVANAKVEVFSNENVLLYTLYTDESGKTEPIELEAPPKEYALEQGEPQPYETYNAVISADGYDTVNINGVQVFAGAEALQRVITRKGTGNIIINIPPPVLWGDYPTKEPEEEVKPLPPPTGFVVLDEVVIPEYVVVHMGDPRSGAENIYVPYKDYIKNVASGEIYSTWDREAILANILAIQSFVLNRVYTEWYRNRGYNFTITSSTRYDQTYSPERTIYQNISELVDEYFTTYIKRVNQKQPLFAQYCDGRNVSCPGWMTQWGSENLARQGYTAVEILKNFYGDDIYLEQAYRVSGVPISYPGEPLALGSVGSDVTTIQNQLNTISNTYTAIPKLRNDGIFGEQTQEAVSVFQGVFNLSQTGVVDLATWYQISQIYVAIARLAEL